MRIEIRKNVPAVSSDSFGSLHAVLPCDMLNDRVKPLSGLSGYCRSKAFHQHNPIRISHTIAKNNCSPMVPSVKSLRLKVLVIASTSASVSS